MADISHVPSMEAAREQGRAAAYPASCITTIVAT